jgi:nucleoside-diphosphate-sugar epimerase
MSDRFTIVGGRGFIGRALSERLRTAGHAVSIRTHLDAATESGPLGHVIYASGIAGAAANDPAYAYGAHVDGVRRILETARFDSFLYLSSARVYGGSADTSERAPLAVEPDGGRDLYRITKIAGEARVLAHPSPAVRVARLSNVTGESFTSSLFLSDVLRQAAASGRVSVRTTRTSAKDYITVADACRYLVAIASGGAERLYNVAWGANITNGAIYDALIAQGIQIDIVPGAADVSLPVVSVRRLQSEFGAPHESVLTNLPGYLERFRSHAAAARREAESGAAESAR